MHMLSGLTHCSICLCIVGAHVGKHLPYRLVH